MAKSRPIVPRNQWIHRSKKQFEYNNVYRMKKFEVGTVYEKFMKGSQKWAAYGKITNLNYWQEYPIDLLRKNFPKALD